MKKFILIAFLLQVISIKAQQTLFQWAKRTGGSGSDNGNSVTVDFLGNVYTTGHFQGTVDFNPGTGVFLLTSAGAEDIFVRKLDASGNFIWAGSMGGVGSDDASSIKVDNSGNVYTTGSFEASADFDPGTGVFNLTSLGGPKDIFVSKLDASGNFVWAKQMGGVGSINIGSSIALDVSGNVLTTGRFGGTGDFDPGPGTYNLSAISSFDMFISKLDGSGNFIWAKQISGDLGFQIGNCITTDNLGNVYTTGMFEGTTDFDPGSGIYNLTTAGGLDIFISKLDASGNFVWAKQMVGDIGNDDWGNSIILDSSGNIYTTGFFVGTDDFDPGPGIFDLTSIGSNDIFINKLDASGNFIWAKQMGGTGIDISNSIALDVFGNIYTTGIFENTVDFDPGTGTYNLSSFGLYDIFISKLDPSGNFIWAKQIGGTGFDIGASLSLDVSGNIYTIGQFMGTVDFDPDAGTFILTSAGSSDIFIHKMSQSSSLPVSFGFINAACDGEKVSITWSTLQEFNSSRFDIERGVNGSCWNVIGSITASTNSSTEKLYQFIDYASLKSMANYRIAEYDIDRRVHYSMVISIQCSYKNEIKLAPNPVHNIAWIQIKTQMPTSVEMHLYDVKGTLVFMQKINLDRGANSIPLRMSGFTNGIYELKIQTNTSIQTFKFLKQSD